MAEGADTGSDPASQGAIGSELLFGGGQVYDVPYRTEVINSIASAWRPFPKHRVAIAS